MNRLTHFSPRLPALLALALLFLLALPAARQVLERSMTLHMLVQYPLLALCGFLLAGALRGRWRTGLARWNAHGISGLASAAVILAVLMIPRVLDLALVDGRVATAKWLALLACGAAVRLSWRPAGWLVQGFFLGNVLPMTAVAGTLYEESPIRICNAYLLDDQVRLGQWLVGICAVIAVAWLALLLRGAMHSDATVNQASD